MKLDEVAWQDYQGDVITHDEDGYQIDVGSYQDTSHSQTTVLTIPAAVNQEDSVFYCVITSNEYAVSARKTVVHSDVFSKLRPSIHLLKCIFLLIQLSLKRTEDGTLTHLMIS